MEDTQTKLLVWIAKALSSLNEMLEGTDYEFITIGEEQELNKLLEAV